MGRERNEKLEDLRASNEHLREENESLKEQVKMIKQRIKDMDKHMDTSTKLLPLFKKKFEECQDSLTTVRID
jgi:peptidoglycan hydrolase CwlO-like protein